MARVTGSSRRDTDRIHEERRERFSQDRDPRPDARLSEEGQRRLEQGRAGQQERTGSQTGRISVPSLPRSTPETDFEDIDFDLDTIFGGGEENGGVPGGQPSSPTQAGLFGGGSMTMLLLGGAVLAGGIALFASMNNDE